MAKQESIIKFDGALGEVSMLKTKDGYTARKKSGVKKSVIMEDPSLWRIRRNMAEFELAAKAGSIIRRAFRSQLQAGAKDRRLSGRMVRVLSKVLKSDPNPRGTQTVVKGALATLKGFQFNNEVHLIHAFVAPYTATIDRVSGSLTVAIAAFVPDESVTKVPTATHFQLTSIGCDIDFVTEEIRFRLAESPKIPLNALQQEAITLTTSIPNSTQPLFLSFGIRYYEQEGELYLPAGKSNALSIVQVDNVTA